VLDLTAASGTSPDPRSPLSLAPRSHLSDDKKHGLKELASLDLVTEGGQRGIDVSRTILRRMYTSPLQLS
jgi:hypothetical protein